MHRATRNIWVFVGATVLIAAACSPPPPDEDSYIDHLLSDRTAKDEWFKTGSDSPVPLDRRSWMLPLRYYDPDLAFRVPAQLLIEEEQPVFEIPTSTGQLRQMQRVGKLVFALNSESRTLSAFVELPAQITDRLFVPFRDETNLAETYPSGRYMDLDRTPTGIYDLDFNLAYHPYCYYDEQYDCPYPPLENRLATAVRAGEKLPPEEERRFPSIAPEPPTPEPSEPRGP